MPAPGATLLTVVVVWTGYRPGPWTLRSLRDAGHRTVALHPSSRGGRSVACPKPMRCPSPADDPDGFLAALDRVCWATSADAVLPLDEAAVQLLAHRVDGRVSGARVVGPTAGQYRMLCDKEELARTAERAGAGSPASVTVGRDGPRGPWPSLPSVVKPRETAMGPSLAVTVVADVGARAAATREILRHGEEAVVQERLVGPHWTVHAVRDGEGRFAAILGRIIRTHPRDAGIPSTIRVVAREGPPVDAARRLLEVADYRGLANVQLFEQGGRMLIHDVNLRPPAPVALSILSGLSMPAFGTQAALGLPWPIPTGPVAPLLYLSLFEELRNVRDEGLRQVIAGLRGRHLRGIARDLVARRVLIDPPLRDPFWIPGRASRAAHRLRVSMIKRSIQ